MTRFVVLGCCVFLSLLLLPCPLCVGRIAAIDTISFLLNHLCVHTYIGYILCFAFIPLSIIVKKEKNAAINTPYKSRTLPQNENIIIKYIDTEFANIINK